MVLCFILGENQKKVHSTKTGESQPLTCQTPWESHNQKGRALSTNIGQEENPLKWRNQRTGSNVLKTSRKDLSFTNQSRKPDKGGNEAPSKATTQGHSLPSPNQVAAKDGGEIPPTNTIQLQSLPSPNQVVGKDGNENQPTNTSQGQKKQTLQVND